LPAHLVLMSNCTKCTMETLNLFYEYRRLTFIKTASN